MHFKPVGLIDVDKLSDIVGGRYALTTLVSKRLRAINAGDPLLLEPRPGERIIETVCREIAEGKIWLEKTPTAPTPAGEGESIAELLELE
ncbi:MAG: DNA-directed RNA polymerase subunit omega [Planctomycetota bacterium]